MPPGHEKHPASPPTACAVCGLSLRGQKQVLSREYLSDVYSFCSEGCLKKFVEDPGEYTDEDEETGE